MKKKILITIAVVVVVIVAAGAILVSNLDRIVEARKDTILAQAQEQIGRAVTVGDISVAVFPSIGVSLEGVTLAEDPAFGEAPFVSVGDLRVNVKLLPLLRKQVEIKRLVLNGATINIIRSPQGALNFESMVPAGAEGDASASQPSSGAAAVPLVLAVADIRGGTVHYVDRGAGIDHTVRDIDFSARNVSLDSEMSFELTAAVMSEETDLGVSGRAGPVGDYQTYEALAAVPLEVLVSAGPFDAGALAALLPEDSLAAQLNALGPGTVEASLAVRGTLGALRIEDVIARAAVLGAGEPNVKVEAKASGINPLEAIDPSAITVEASVTAGPLDAGKLGGMVPGGAPSDLSLDGSALVTLSASGTLGNLRVDAKADAASVALAFGEVFRKPAGVPAGLKFSGTVGETAVEISDLEVTLNNLTARGSGSVVTAPEKQRVDLELTSNDADLSAWAPLLPAAADFAPRGTVALAVTAKGATANGATPAVEGTLTVKNVGAKLAQLPAPVTGAGATVHFTDHSARCDDVALSVGQSKIRATFSATSLAPLAATFRVTSERIHRDDFQVPVQKVPRPEVLDDVVASGTVRADPGKPEANVLDAKVTSASGTVANLDYTDLQATIRSEGDIIRIEQFTANTLDGKVSGSGTARPMAVPPTFDVQTSVNSIDLTKYFQDKFPNLVSVIEGRIDLNVNIAGAGKTWDEIATSLEGAGGAVVVRGALLNVNLANELVASLQQLPMVPAGLADRLRAKHPQLFSGNSTAFQNLNGEFTINGGKIRSDDLFLKAADFYIKGDGWLGFDRTLDLRTSFVFSEKLSRDIVGELSVARYLQNNEGRIVLPLVLSGDLIKPRIAPDSDAITAALRQGAVDEGKNRLQDEIKDRLGDGVKDLFGGLGKKKDSKAPADSSGGKR